jgi:ActR/RegA family two-component response regulator
MTPGRLITADDVTRELQSPDISGKEKMIPGFQDAFPFEANEDMPLKEVVALAEWNHIKRVLQRCNGNVSEAAQKLGIHRSVLYKKIQKYQS